MRLRITYLLAAAVFLGPLAMQIYLPMLPALAADLDVPRESIQLTFSLFILATGIAQLFTGTLSDRFGRRPVLLAGVAVYIAGSVTCALAGTAGELVAGRIIQAIGGGTGLVVSRAVLSDLYPPTEMARRLAVVIMIMLVGPMFGPLTGGYIGPLFGWRSIFWLLVALAAAVLLLLTLRLPETLPTERRGASKSLRAGFAMALTRPRFWLYATVTTTSAASFYLFMSVIAYLMADLYQEPPERIGQLFLIMALAYGIGNFGATRYAPGLGIARTLSTGAIGAMLGVAMLVALELAIGLTSTTLFAAMAIVTMSQGFFNPSANGGAVAQVPERPGTASSLLSFAMQAVAATLVQLFIGAPTNTIWPLLITLAITHLVCLVAALTIERTSTRSQALNGRP